MYIYDCWYQRMMIAREHPDLNLDTLGITHAFITQVEAPSPGQVVTAMQGENWSPNGEANAVVTAADVSHVSFSVGDVLVQRDHYGAIIALLELGNSIKFKPIYIKSGYRMEVDSAIVNPRPKN